MRFNIDFWKPLPLFVGFSILITLGSFVLFFTHGFKLSTDFTGGLELTVTFDKTTTVEELNASFQKAGVSVEVQPVITTPNRFFLRTTTDGRKSEVASDELKKRVGETFGDRGPRYEASRVVSGVISDENKKGALWVTLFAVLGIGLYMAFRFKAHYAIGAVVAVVHDVIVMLGAISLFQVEVSILTITAILTILGYSVNDTIVLFDRVREHANNKDFTDYRKLMNRSINDVFVRTLIMTFTTISTVVVLWFFSVGGLRDFAFALFVGMISGTYSSIYVASAYMLLANRWKPQI